MGKPRKSNKRLILGVTGSFGSGKTSVARALSFYGAQVIDADKLAHSCIAPQGKAYKKIIDLFGKGILKHDLTIDRRKLANIVFGDIKLLRQLNGIIHPEVIRTINETIKHSRAKFIVLDVPLLIESGFHKRVDKLIVVTISQAQQIKRIRNKTGLSREEILKIIKCQIPLRAKVRLADFVIDNNGTIGETKKQVRWLWKSLA
jgi:dephospho-CoA kinase